MNGELPNAINRNISNFVLNLKEIITLRLPNPWYNFAFAIIFAYLAFKNIYV